MLRVYPPLCPNFRRTDGCVTEIPRNKSCRTLILGWQQLELPPETSHYVVQEFLEGVAAKKVPHAKEDGENGKTTSGGPGSAHDANRDGLHAVAIRHHRNEPWESHPGHQSDRKRHRQADWVHDVHQCCQRLHGARTLAVH